MQRCVFMCFMCKLTAGSLSPLLWLILLSQRCLRFQSKLCWPLEEPGVREQGEEWRWPTKGEAVWCGRQCAKPPLLLYPCTWSCFQSALPWDFWPGPHKTCHTHSGHLHWIALESSPFFSSIIFTSGQRTLWHPSIPTHLPNKFCPQSRRKGLVNSNCLLNEWMVFLFLPAHFI